MLIMIESLRESSTPLDTRGLLMWAYPNGYLSLPYPVRSKQEPMEELINPKEAGLSKAPEGPLTYRVPQELKLD